MRLNNSHGFTLIELAIVLVIIGVLAGSFITTLSSRIDATRIVETRDEMQLIKDALYGYAYSQVPPHLPCPDCNDAACVAAGNTPNDGREDRTGNVCDAAVETGNIPWQTLGISQSDAWGTRYSYWASNAFAGTPGFTLNSTSLGEAQIDDTVAAGANTLATDVAAVIFSHGKDGYGGISEDGAARTAMPVAAAYNDQRENVDVDIVAPMLFVSRAISGEGANNRFDDIVIWISDFEIKAKAVDAGVLP